MTPEQQEAAIVGRLKHPNVFLFSHSRTASNLLSHLLSDQSGWTQSQYHFESAFSWVKLALSQQPFEYLQEDQKVELEERIRQGYHDLQTACHGALSHGQRLFVKNHTFHVWNPVSLSQSLWNTTPALRLNYLPIDCSDCAASVESSNPTIFSDNFLTAWLPIFMIRHPAMVFESWYKAETKVQPIDIFERSGKFHTTFKYTRELYDWYVSKSNACRLSHTEVCSLVQTSKPIVIDADDIFEQTGTIERVCQLCGMDTRRILREWDPTHLRDPSVSARHESFMESLWNSTSVDRAKSCRGVDLVSKHQEWRLLYGDTVAAELNRLMEDALPDYMYLKSHKT